LQKSQKSQKSQKHFQVTWTASRSCDKILDKIQDMIIYQDEEEETTRMRPITSCAIETRAETVTKRSLKATEMRILRRIADNTLGGM